VATLLHASPTLVRPSLNDILISARQGPRALDVHGQVDLREGEIPDARDTKAHRLDATRGGETVAACHQPLYSSPGLKFSDYCRATMRMTSSLEYIYVSMTACVIPRLGHGLCQEQRRAHRTRWRHYWPTFPAGFRDPLGRGYNQRPDGRLPSEPPRLQKACGGGERHHFFRC
jgi:hypothetical protein